MKTKKLLFIFYLAVLTVNLPSLSAQEASIPLADGHILKAEITKTDSKNPAVLLLHQCNRDQRMWKPVVQALNEIGYNTMTVDMRGYGKSVSSKYNIDKDDYDYVTGNFRDDIDQINEFWSETFSNASELFLIGASCGGGQATKTAVMNNRVKAMVLISPALRDHWIASQFREDFFNKKNKLPVLGIATEDDTNALNAINDVFEHNSAKDSQKLVYKGRIHGEPLFTNDEQLIPYIVDWIQRVNR